MAIRIMKRSSRDIAIRIAYELFKDGTDRQANRLVMEMKDGKFGAGWGQHPVQDLIERILNEESES